MESLDGQIIYQIFPRNYSEEGTFKKITEDLDRIKDLGVDIIYLMPINEIGKINRKGTYGSPYASIDYYSISPDLGTEKDLKELINETHKRGMKIIVDMVFDHTSPDSVLTYDHIEFYYIENGLPVNRISEWDDVIDLDVERQDTQEYLIEVLRYWQSVGFDGFRFDVASIIPLKFFTRARLALGNDAIFFAESVDDGFKRYLRRIKHYYEEDENLPPTFDLLYNYNYYCDLRKYFDTGDKEYARKAFRTINKESVLNREILRSNCLENHDNDRIAALTSSNQLDNFLTMFILLRGAGFIYAGQEYGLKHKPNLFEKDPILWANKDEEVFDFVKELIKLKKEFGPIEAQNIEEIGDLFVFKVLLRNATSERLLILNLNKEPVNFKKIIAETDDDELVQIIYDKVKEEKITELTHPMIVTLIEKGSPRA